MSSRCLRRWSTQQFQSQGVLKADEATSLASDDTQKEPKKGKETGRVSLACDAAHGTEQVQVTADGGAHTAPRQYTLVLDLDETLIHYKEEDDETGQVNFRPFLDEFLVRMGRHFNLIVFTASLPEYADPILDHLDPERKLFQQRFYRHHTTELLDGTVKDIGIVGVDLSKVIIVDNVPENFGPNKDNGIFIKPWYDDRQDTALRDLCLLLEKMTGEKCPDVRVFLSDYRQEMIARIQRGSVTPLH